MYAITSVVLLMVFFSEIYALLRIIGIACLYYADQNNRRRHDIMLEQYVCVILSIYFSSNNSPYNIFSLAPRYRLNNPAVLVNIYIYTYPHTYTDINIYKYNSYAYFYGADKFMTNLQTSGYASVCVCVCV